MTMMIMVMIIVKYVCMSLCDDNDDDCEGWC